MDSRFPHIYRLADAPGFTGDDRKRCERTAKAIASRVPGLRYVYNAYHRTIFFHYGDYPLVGPLQLPVFTQGGSMCNYSSSDIDDLVRMIRIGQMDKNEKDAIAARNEKAEKSRKQTETEKFLDDRRPDALNYAAHLMRKRRGVQKVISCSKGGSQ